MNRKTRKIKYILDKNIHIKLEKLINEDGLSKDGIILLEKFINKNVSRTTPKKSFGKFAESDFAMYFSIGRKLIDKKVVTKLPSFFQIQSSGGKLYPHFNYIIEDNKGCRKIGIQEFGKVGEDNNEFISKAIKE